ncbi:MAG: hypothetical protein MUF86_11050 [Akkermansiaceae bacterium]|jgi:hypothetical protein|nr:hypothetical protein [Akkermansiaceae bacterium]
MNQEFTHSNVLLDDKIPPSLLAALCALPSEHRIPSRETDAAVLADARKTLSAIRRRRFHARLWPTLAAAACFVLFIHLLSRPTATPDSTNKAPAEDKYALILREVSAVFPRQVQAIIADGGELRISLADYPVSNHKKAVVVELCEQNKCTAIITYVGQTVEIGAHRITVRTNEKGAIVIDDPEFHGTGDHQGHSLPGLHIKTRCI